MKDFLIEVVRYTDGWVIVAVTFIYFLYEAYKKYSSDKALHKTIEILAHTVEAQTDRMVKSIDRLTDRISTLVDKSFGA
jgi:hypothetical protein